MHVILMLQQTNIKAHGSPTDLLADVSFAIDIHVWNQPTAMFLHVQMSLHAGAWGGVSPSADVTSCKSHLECALAWLLLWNNQVYLVQPNPTHGKWHSTNGICAWGSQACNCFI